MLKMDLIQIKDLCFSYPTKKDTLKHINIKVKKGTFTCIVGENGSGKSTLLKCILGLNKGYTGEIIKEDRIYTDIDIILTKESFLCRIIFG